MLLIDKYNEIKTKYNQLRLVLHKCLIHRASVKKYHNRYKMFLNYLRRVHPGLLKIYAENKFVPVFPVKSRLQQNQQQQQQQRRRLIPLLPSNTVIISGEKAYFQYVAIKCVLTHLFEYEKLWAIYLSNLDNSIITMVNGMNDFRDSFNFFLQIVIKEDNTSGNDQHQWKDILQSKYSEAFIMKQQM